MLFHRSPENAPATSAAAAGRPWRLRMAFAILLGASTLGAGGCASIGGGQSAVFRAKDSISPALVHIRPVKEVFSQGQRRELVVLGSGFIVTADGYVLTNEHVAGENDRVYCVLSDKTEVEAKVVGTDPYTDIAVLKLDADRPFQHVRIGDSDKIQAGQYVLALGSPHGLARSVSMGIISVTDRHLVGDGFMGAPYNNWIQTDAAINPGNSGGPLVNLRGEVIGVNSRKLSGAENLGFAIPINIASEVMRAIIKEGRVRRSWIGVNLQEMLAKTKDPAQKGVLIADIDPMSPAQEAGVQTGDILLAINGTPVHARFEEDLPAVQKLIADLPIDSEATLSVQRGKDAIELKVKTLEKSALKGKEVAFSEWGFTVAEITPAVGRGLGLKARQGALITGVQVGGIAGSAGLAQGDVILSVDEKAVEDLAHFQGLYTERLQSKQPLTLFFIKRGAITRYVMVKQEQTAQGGERHEP